MPEPTPTPADLRRALAVDAVGPALNKHGAWLPDHVRQAVADAVLAAVEPVTEPAPAESQPADGCLFCLPGTPANRLLLESATCYARHDNYPATPGHIEIVPRRHVASFFDLTPAEAADVYALLLAARKILDAEHQPDGYTIGINDGQAAGRTIDHLHIHLIPRYHGDVEDPRGGIRRGLPNGDPDQWTEAATAPAEAQEADPLAGPWLHPINAGAVHLEPEQPIHCGPPLTGVRMDPDDAILAVRDTELQQLRDLLGEAVGWIHEGELRDRIAAVLADQPAARDQEQP